jgi:hypothetical protein
MNKQSKKKANIYLSIGFFSPIILVLIATILEIDFEESLFKIIIIPLILLSSISFIIGLLFYLDAKGRSRWWILAPLTLNMIGLIILAFLKDRNK